MLMSKGHSFVTKRNPSAFRIDDRLAKVSKRVREARLLAAVRDAASGRGGDSLQVQYMFYDTQEDLLVVYKDTSFAAIRGCCIDPVTSPYIKAKIFGKYKNTKKSNHNGKDTKHPSAHALRPHSMCRYDDRTMHFHHGDRHPSRQAERLVAGK